jgi:SOS response regulatory protein OraA/RecX
MVLETAIKVSMEVKEALREKLMEQETFNELITEMFNRLAQQGWREITSPNRR